MKLYKREIRPYAYDSGGHGFSDSWKELEEWQPEENEDILKEKHKDLRMGYSVLKIRERYVLVNEILSR